MESQQKSEPKYPVSLDKVISADGTVIGYRKMGSGPGLLILHGGARASQHYLQLAEHLADAYTVTIPDRRGRGLSGPIGADYSLDKACEDVQALMQATGAEIVFGHSGGGFIALESALRLPINTLLLYDPALSIRGSLPLEWVPAFGRALDRNDAASAMVSFLKGLKMNWMSLLPGWALAPMFRMMLKGPESAEITELLKTFIPELKIIEPYFDAYERYRTIQARTLIMYGGKSPAFLRDIMPTLESLLPNARRVELPGLDHSAPEESPSLTIANTLRPFLAAVPEMR